MDNFYVARRVLCDFFMRTRNSLSRMTVETEKLQCSTKGETGEKKTIKKCNYAKLLGFKKNKYIK